MTTLFEPAFAKINLTLDVLGLRDDGFHDIKTVMQTISLRDDVEIDVGTGKPWVLKCDKEGIPCDERNLAWKAAKLFQEVTGKDLGGIEIRITKRIPSEAGLAGGSADAAAVLRALNEHFGAPLSIGALAEVGGQIGSDIPFCVIGGTCMCEGRGERLRKLPNMPVAIPKRPDNNAMEGALLAGDLGKVAENVYNVFDPLVTEEHLEMNYIKSIMNSYGALAYQMTGSGSAVFAIMPDFEYAAVVCNMLRENYPSIFIAMPV